MRSQAGSHSRPAKVGRQDERAPGDTSDSAFTILGAFEDTGAALTGVGDCSLAWGDADLDGDLGENGDTFAALRSSFRPS